MHRRHYENSPKQCQKMRLKNESSARRHCSATLREAVGSPTLGRFAEIREFGRHGGLLLLLLLLLMIPKFEIVTCHANVTFHYSLMRRQREEDTRPEHSGSFHSNWRHQCCAGLFEIRPMDAHLTENWTGKGESFESTVRCRLYQVLASGDYIGA